MTDCDLMLAVFTSCSGNNGSGAYIPIELPVLDEFQDPCYFPGMTTACDTSQSSRPNAFTHTVTLPDGVTLAQVSQYYRLGTDEAVITIINLPPKAAYFSFQTYLFSRQLSGDCTGAPPNPCRYLPFASIGSGINQVAIQDQSGLSWSGGTVAIISTANSSLFTHLYRQFLKVGGKASLVFQDPIGKAAAGNLPKRQIPACDVPHSVSSAVWPPYYCAITRPGLDTTATAMSASSDEFNSFLRYAIPNDVGIQDPSSPSEVWKQNIASNIRVYRVRAPELKQAVLFKDISTQQIPGKLYNTNETEALEGVYSLTDAVAELNSVYVKAFMAAALPNQVVPTSIPLTKSEIVTPSQSPETDAGERPFQMLVGPACISQMFYSCLGDNQDTDSYMYLKDITLNNTAVITGVDSANPEVNNASYISLSLYSQVSLKTDINSTLSQTNASRDAATFYKGTLGAGNRDRDGLSSAADFVQKMVAAGVAPQPSAKLAAFLPRLFVAIYTRDCNSGNALLMQYCTMTPGVDSYTVAIDPAHFPPPVDTVTTNPVVFIRRAYLRPRTLLDPPNQKKTNGADPRHMFVPILNYF